MAELRAAIEERDALRRVIPETAYTWLRHRPASRLVGNSAVTVTAPFDDMALVDRIIRAYKLSNTTRLGAPDSFWLQALADMKRPIHEMLMSGNVHDIGRELRNPAGNTLFYGFDTITSDQPNPQDPNWRDWMRQTTYDNLLRLAEAIGAHRIEYPEGSPRDEPIDPESLLREIDGIFGFRVDFPNPFADEVGLETSRGVASYRAVQALYQAFRIHGMVGLDQRVLEIGAGLGRTAYYATQFGVRDYTIIDLPITNVAQSYFLGRSLGEGHVSFFQEIAAGVKVLPPSAFLEAKDRYGIVINVDSMTELARDTAIEYCREIKSRADVFLSINHEHNQFTVQEICHEVGLKRRSRELYWLRRGYVDETFS